MYSGTRVKTVKTAQQALDHAKANWNGPIEIFWDDHGTVWYDFYRSAWYATKVYEEGEWEPGVDLGWDDLYGALEYLSEA